MGAGEIREQTAHLPAGNKILSISDINDWIRQTQQNFDNWGIIAATFVIDSEGYLRITDRHSEHIACAGGKSVFSAGEVFFQKSKTGLEIVEITNQSTGFCPEAKSWSNVAKALDLIGITHPYKFTHEFIFRRCCVCNQINIVKDNIFICSVCGTNLSQRWNFS